MNDATLTIEDIAEKVASKPMQFVAGRGIGVCSPSRAAMAFAMGAMSLEPMTLREAIHGVDEAEPPKPPTPRVSCWGYRGSQQYFVNEHGEPVPVRLSDPTGNLKEWRKLLKHKQRSR